MIYHILKLIYNQAVAINFKYYGGKKMKKIISMLLIAILILGLAGCGKKPVEDGVKEVNQQEEENKTDDVTKSKITIGFQADPVGGIQKVNKCL